MDQQNKHFKDWMKFLDEDEIKFQLITASLFITAYDLLIDTIIQKIKDFYTTSFENGEWILDEGYVKNVKSLHKSDIIIASLLWLKNHNVILEEEVEQVKLFKDHRNELAHELSKMITDSDKRTKTEYVSEIKELYFKIHRWWFIEFEMGVNPDLGKLNIDDLDFNEVLSFIMLPIQYINNIVDDEVIRIEKKRSSKK